MRWLFREQPFEDYGIDAHIELVDDNTVRGKLIALQIKTGASYFGAPAAEGGWWFRGDATHFQYWLEFSIPVVVVLVDLDSRLCHWQLVTPSTVQKTDTAQWKLRVPTEQVLDSSAVPALRHAAETPTRRAPRPLGAPVGSFSPIDLEVHPTLQGGDALPEYVVRDHDHALDELITDAVGSAARSGCAILLGRSCTGKTRALYEALHRDTEFSPLKSGWRLWPQVNPLPPKRFLDELADIGPETIVWLNEAQRYLYDPVEELRAAIATALRELLADDSRGPVLVLGTLWPEHWHELTCKPDRGQPDRFAVARRLLSGRQLIVPDSFTHTEVGLAKQSSDLVLSTVAARVIGTDVTQQLAGAPDLLQRYDTATTPQRALIHAAMDARRLGHGEWFPPALLRTLADTYLPEPERSAAVHDASWFDTALADLRTSGPASGPIVHHSLLGYRLDDFLDQHGRIQRRFEFPCHRFWAVIAETDMPADTSVRMADNAAARIRWQIAADLYETSRSAGERLSALARRCASIDAFVAATDFAQRAAAAGAPYALTALACSMRHRGRAGWGQPMRQAAELGDLQAITEFAALLEENGDKRGAEAMARQAMQHGSWKATAFVAEWRDLDFPDEAEQLILDLPEHMRGEAAAWFVCARDSNNSNDAAEQFAVSLAGLGHLDALIDLAEQRRDGRSNNESHRLLALLPPPASVRDQLRVAHIHVQVGAGEQARELLATIAHTRDIEDQIAIILQRWPELDGLLLEVVTALNERVAANQLIALMATSQTPTSTEADREARYIETLDAAEAHEVSTAYVTLAGYHARRGEFDQAHTMAMAASELGDWTGLVELSHALLERGDTITAETLALCAVNMSDTDYPGLDEPYKALTQARASDKPDEWGLTADGTPAAPR